MNVADAQREVRTVFLGGFMGRLVSGALWLASAAMATWGTPRRAIVVRQRASATWFRPEPLARYRASSAA